MSLEVILIAIFMFFILVGVHEWGHFYVAKRVGILVREFAIGFGPKLFSYKKNETQYTFRALPMGGYVRMAGEDPELVEIKNGQTIAVSIKDGVVTHLYLDKLEERSNVLRGTVQSIDLEHGLEVELEVEGEIQKLAIDPRAFMVARGKETQIAPWNRQFGSKKVGQRSLVIFAGPAMNFVLAVVLFFTFVMVNGVPIDNPNSVEIGSVVEASPAEAAGLQGGDQVLEVNGEKVGGNTEKLIALVGQSANEEMIWQVERNGNPMTIRITPEVSDDQVGRVGVAIHLPLRTPSLMEGIEGTFTTTKNATTQIFDALGMLVTFQLSMDDLGGPVRMTEMTGEAYSMGATMLLFWVALLSLYLGIFNLLPFPALDGSRLLFFGIEAVRGKPVDPQRESLVHFIGFAMLMVLMVAVTYNDILRLFKG